MHLSRASQSKTYHHFPESISFGFHTAEDIRKISHVQVTNSETFNQLGHPTRFGLYDPLMGPVSERGDNCATCSLNIHHCPGHFGHIELPLPVFHPLFHYQVLNLLKMTCPSCKKLCASENKKALLKGQLDLLRHGFVSEAQQLADFAYNSDEEDDDLRDVKKRSKAKKREDATPEGKTNNDIETMVVQILKTKRDPLEMEGIQTRTVESLRQAYLKEFQGKLKSAKCGECLETWDRLQLFKSQIFYSVKGIHEEKEPVEQQEKTIEKPKKSVKKKQKTISEMKIFTAREAREHLRETWRVDQDLLCHLYPVLFTTKCPNPIDVFFLEVIPVTPCKFRPVNFMEGSITENGQTMILRKVILDAYVLKLATMAIRNPNGCDSLPSEDSKRAVRNLRGQTELEKFQTAWQELQNSVGMVVDSSTDKSGNGLTGFKQVLEKKEGLFRMHMMGKRVDYAARSVITPDPNLDVEEVGVPDCFAKKLTYRVPVTSWNCRELKDLVRNGPDIYPGAHAIEDENGLVKVLSMDIVGREALAKTLLTPAEANNLRIQSVTSDRSKKHDFQRALFKPKIVHRHLQSGDVMLINRQPTLHKPSVMAHKARVLMGEKTLRLHYANCKAYNADFDGDEMNAHFPQNEVARSEAYNIVGVAHQYLVPKDGTPLSGLIQDHMISGVKLTIRGQFFDRADYQQLVFSALGGHVYEGATKLLPPVILKPVTLWSGKQILSTIIINLTPKAKPLINMNSTAKISVKDWQTVEARPWKGGGTKFKNAINMSESEVIFRQGELLCGVLDKMHYGATSYSLIHAFSELYGGQYSCRLLSSFSRLFTSFLQLRGFTLGVEDILVTAQADQKRREIINRVKTIGDNTAAKAVGVNPEVLKKQGMAVVRRRLQEAQFSRFPLKRMTIDREYKTETDQITNQVNKACIPSGLHKLFPANNLSLMIQSGAKGSSVNAMQISCLLGQIELEGKRPPLMISGRSLPSFVAYDTSPRAGGFISGRFMTGIRPQEFFYHCMAGREGLIDTAVKTSRSGYLQRCLIKHLEGVKVAYDNTVRDSDGTVLQFLYGEDGLDICKSQYLNDKGIPFLVDNQECVKLADTSISDQSAHSQVEAAQKAIKRWTKKHGSLVKLKERKSGFLKFSSEFQVDAASSKKRKMLSDGSVSNSRSSTVDEIVKEWRAMSESKRKSYLKKQSVLPPDPVNAHYPLANHLDVLDEHLSEMVSRYLDRPGAAAISRKQLTRLVYSKSIAASCEPGESVGLLAAQSIGEPSTQMTLNTFHFAGRGEMNVTLGIPRLREILTIASKNISTPSMDIPLLKKGPTAIIEAEKVKLKLTKVTLADVLENVEVTERYSLEKVRYRIYGFTFNFLPHSSYKDRFCVKPKQVLRYFENHFVEKILLPGIRSETIAQSNQSLFVVTTARKSKVIEGEAAEKVPKEDVDEGEAEAPSTANNEEESESEEEEEDTEAAKHSNRNDEQEYADEEEEDETRIVEEAEDDGFVDEDALDDEEKETDAQEEEKVVQGTENSGIGEAKEATDWEMTEEVERNMGSRLSDMVNKHQWIRDYEYDAREHLHCRLTLAIPLCHHKVDMAAALRRWAQKAVVYAVPDINRAFVIEPKSDGDDVIIKTDGVNIPAMFNYSNILDLNRLYCNDIHSIAAHYGVEAASQVIVKEVRNVFKVYGITVDPRHLSLIASFMTSGGGYRAFSRMGMSDCSSPLQQITFETAIEFLKTAVLQGKTDYLKNPSSRLVMGLPGLEGTGSFSLITKLY